MQQPLGAVAAAGAAAGVRWTRFPADPASSTDPWSPADVTVVVNARLDGRVVDGDPPALARGAVLALDGVVDAATRAALLAALLGPDGDEGAPTPPPSLWERATADAVGGAASWGLRDGALAAVAAHPAVATLGARLAVLLPGCDILLLPAHDMGCTDASFPSLLANAPTSSDTFTWHTDADPAAIPPSPWTAAYGRYANGAPAAPRLVTLVVHVGSAWRAEWHGETLLRDAASGAGVLVAPAPGRVVLFDGDVAHRLVPPSPAAGRPRYSLAWRLALAPTTAGGAPPDPAAVAAALGALAPPADVGSAAVLTSLVRRVARERRGREGKE